MLELIRDELNIKQVRFLASAEGIVQLSGRPSFRALGPRFGKRTEAAAAAIRALCPCLRTS